MNLRDKFLWNATIAISSLVLIWNTWNLYEMRDTSNNALFNYETDEKELGTDETLEKKVNELENVYVARDEMKFIMADNPVDLNKVISIDGVGNTKRRKNLWVSSIINSKDSEPLALINYKDNTYKVQKGDSNAGGIVLDISSTKVIFQKNEKILTYNLGLNQNIE